MLSGYKLQYIRRLKGLSQKHIAECIGVSIRWVSKVECENSEISEETYLKWIDALYGKIKPVKDVKVDGRRKKKVD